MIASPTWLPLLLLVARVWALQQPEAPARLSPGEQVAGFLHNLALALPHGEPVETEAAPGAAITARHPLQTPPPSLLLSGLLARQDNGGQVAALSAQIQSLSLASSVVSQASRLVSQTSQQLAQQVTQLSQSTDRLSQSISQLQTSAQQAQQSVQQAQQSARQAQQSAQDASRQATQSASSAVSSAISSAQSSASSVLAANLASVSSSAASIMAAASASALSMAKVAASQAASQVQAAQAEATGARADAATQVSKAQGTAVSVTQAAVAIVATFFGSSLLTVGAFYVVLRYKAKQKRRRTKLIAMRGTIGSPKQIDNSGDGNERALGGMGGAYGGGAYGYPIDLKNPPPRKPVAAAAAADVVVVVGDEKRRPSSDYGPREDRDSTADAVRRFPTFGSGGSADELVGPGARMSNASKSPTLPPPSLQQWLSQGTVSPFGTLTRGVGGAGNTTNNSSRKSSTSNINTGVIGQAITSSETAPADRRQQQLRAMTSRSMGMGSGLPLRDRQ